MKNHENILYFLERILYKNASAIVPLSSDMKKSIIKRYPSLKNKPIEVIENISEIDRFQKGFNKELNSFSSIGYNEIYDYLSNNLDLDEAINLIKKRTRNLVRHQYNWFKLNDPEIKWFDSSKHSINYISEKILKEKIENKF